ncbi:hypothetical protein HMPREF9685_01933 [Klebsiella oxytoca 09-7231]|uniref:DUF1804 family protein n=1 Tax=Klebsiella oxytoca TaxID=571 RepID=UPI00066D5C6F|nr:DUF1804 family protein [Klebsiella oxytoca]KMV85308.1 hypothetical protein HMPREF9685_01933 [Klebsiella oxytoca 09-7231]
MAHPPETREKVRRLYIQSQLSLQIVSSQCGVSFATAARWKKDAQDSGDDWDKLRAANVLAGNGMEDVGRAILMGLLVQYQTTIEQLNVDSQLPPQARVELLASLSDAFNKSTVASKRVLPETSQLATAMEVITMLSTFISEHYPKHMEAFVQVLEPFGNEVQKHYG